MCQSGAFIGNRKYMVIFRDMTVKGHHGILNPNVPTLSAQSPRYSGVVWKYANGATRMIYTAHSHFPSLLFY